MRYRREIDGLRAIAVLPVILFHAGFTTFSGGFVGVDVFFVISGYLITSILLEEMEAGSLSISRFYERRARRILPALFLVVLACLPFAYMWMLPSQLKDFAASIVTVVLALSNLYFLSQVDYFAPAAELQPMLHTWSLAIEEQYYLLFPLVLLTLRNRSRRTQIFCLASLTLFSFAFAEWGWRTDPARNFFFTLSRFWEIGVGSLCALLLAGRQPQSNNFVASIGFALILLAVFHYDASMPFPSFYTLVPVGGAALIILSAGETTWIARLLSSRVLVGIGLVSYSAYLWHQPLFAFARLRSFGEPNPYLMASLAGAALLLGWATWRFIEQPFRWRPVPLLATRRSVFGASAAGAALIGSVGLAIYLDDGLEWRLDESARRYAEANIPRAPLVGPCTLTEGSSISYPIEVCRSGNRAGEVDVLLAGDSHSAAISEVVRDQLTAKGIGFYHASYNGCLALPDLQPYGQLSLRDCQTFAAKIDEYASEEGVKTVILAGRFPWYFHGTQFDNQEGGIEAGEPAWYDISEYSESVAEDDERRDRVLSAYEARIRDLALRYNIVLVYPIPEAGWDVPSTAFQRTFVTGAPLTTSYAVYKKRAQKVNALFDRLVAELPNVHAARIYEALCSDETGRCVNVDAKGVYYVDDDHLSTAGAQLVAPIIAAAVQSAMARHFD